MEPMSEDKINSYSDEQEITGEKGDKGDVGEPGRSIWYSEDGSEERVRSGDLFMNKTGVYLYDNGSKKQLFTWVKPDTPSSVPYAFDVNYEFLNNDDKYWVRSEDAIITSHNVKAKKVTVEGNVTVNGTATVAGTTTTTDMVCDSIILGGTLDEANLGKIYRASTSSGFIPRYGKIYVVNNYADSNFYCYYSFIPFSSYEFAFEATSEKDVDEAEFTIYNSGVVKNTYGPATNKYRSALIYAFDSQGDPVNVTMTPTFSSSYGNSVTLKVSAVSADGKKWRTAKFIWKYFS